jgi:nuclear pore complex protein Nup98-Nup96
MARFTALPSDTSEDEKYVASPPKKPPQPRPRHPFPPPRAQNVNEDADMASDSGSSRADGEDDGEDEDDLPSDSSRLSPDIRRANARARAGGDAYATEEQGDGEESSESSRSSVEVLLPEHRRGDPSIIPWAQRIGIDPQKMHVMHASFFPGPESAEALKHSSAEKPDRTRLTPNGLHRKHSRDSEGDGLRAATQEVCRSPRFSPGTRLHNFLCPREPPFPMMLDPSLFDPLANMLEWRAPPPL